jgi:sulfur relay protein TusB/DsrH
MLFLISSAPDTKEFKSAYKIAQQMNAEVCLLQNAVYASRNLLDSSFYMLKDELHLRGIREDEVSGKLIDYSQLAGMMAESDKVVGLF